MFLLDDFTSMMESPAPVTSAPVSPDQRDGRHGAGGPGGRGVWPLAILVTETIYNVVFLILFYGD